MDTFDSIVLEAVRKPADRLRVSILVSRQAGGYSSKLDRQVGRSLQKLRRKGLVSYSRKRWTRSVPSE